MSPDCSRAVVQICSSGRTLSSLRAKKWTRGGRWNQSFISFAAEISFPSASHQVKGKGQDWQSSGHCSDAWGPGAVFRLAAEMADG